jgi:integrase
MSNPYKEFNQYLYDRITSKLREAKEYELLAFALCGILLMLRQQDILLLKWNQIDFTNNIILDVMIRKHNIKQNYPIPLELNDVLKTYYVQSNDDLVFPNLKNYSAAKKIGSLIGNDNFHNHDLRRIGITMNYFTTI